MLKPWCEQRRNKKLYELQIEMCDWATNALAASEEFARYSKEGRDTWTAGIAKAAESLRKSKTAVQWEGFGAEEVFPYTSKKAEAIKNKQVSDPLQ
jgi:hypothetical protein